MKAVQRDDIELMPAAPFQLSGRVQREGVRLVNFTTLASTNEEAIRSARSGERGPVWLVTDFQTSGRGRRQRAWSAPRGNLAATFLKVTDISPAMASTLGFVAGLALIEALNDLCHARGSADAKLRLKWPNDVLLNGAKLAGILIEAEQVLPEQLAVAVGIGVNVVSAPQNVPYPASALVHIGPEFDAPQVFMALSARWHDNVALWDRGRGFDAIRARWLSYATGLGAPVRVEVNHTIIEGIFETIDADGRLIVLRADGARVPVSAGDVYFSAAASTGRM